MPSAAAFTVVSRVQLGLRQRGLRPAALGAAAAAARARVAVTCCGPVPAAASAALRLRRTASACLNASGRPSPRCAARDDVWRMLPQRPPSPHRGPPSVVELLE